MRVQTIEHIVAVLCVATAVASALSDSMICERVQVGHVDDITAGFMGMGLIRTNLPNIVRGHPCWRVVVIHALRDISTTAVEVLLSAHVG